MTSVIKQTYRNFELIVVDDASTDGSAAIIGEFIALNPSVKFIALAGNGGNCRAFNQGLKIAKGDYVIDLAADDVLFPERIAEGVRGLHEKGHEHGVNFTDAAYIDADNRVLYHHSDRFPHSTVPQGDVYVALIRHYFICPPSMMFRKTVIEYLGGYDESLSYEDFDFWIRSSRVFKYCYTPEVLVSKRVLKGSLSSRQFERGSKHQETTYRVCKKIYFLNRTKEERTALTKRIAYEIKCSIEMMNIGVSLKLFVLLARNLSKQLIGKLKPLSV